MSGQYGNKVAAEDKEGDEQVPRPTEPSPQTSAAPATNPATASLKSPRPLPHTRRRIAARGAIDAREPRVRQRRPPRAAPAQDLGDSNYSEFFGYGGSLFNNTPYEQARPAIAPRAG